MSVSTPPDSQAPIGPMSEPAKDPLRAMREAARYALLRRMSSAIRHQIAGALQPVGMLASLMERRAQAEPPNAEALRKNAVEIGDLSRSASRECVALMEWIAPPEGALMAVGDGIGECVHMLATELSFRGFEIVNKAKSEGALVSRSSLRSALTAALIVLTDGAERAGQVEVSVRAGIGLVTVSVSMAASAHGQVPVSAKTYRALSLEELVVLAEEEGVELRQSAHAIELTFVRREPEPALDLDTRWG
jgi:hypothetical protein